MRRILALAALPLLLSACAGKPAAGDDPAAVAGATLVAVGDEAPAFTAPLLGGGAFDLAAQRGKVALVVFFATWCPPCQAEMPHLQQQVWERFGGRDDFAMVSVAREETAEVVAPFVQKHGAGWPFALDADRSVFAKYAEAYIPRSFVVDRAGRVVLQTQGYEEAEFAHMVEVLAAELDKTAP
jgi:peroxiredoxin